MPLYAFFSCNSSSIPRFVTHSLTDPVAKLGQSYATQVKPHRNLMTRHISMRILWGDP